MKELSHDLEFVLALISTQFLALERAKDTLRRKQREGAYSLSDHIDEMTELRILSTLLEVLLGLQISEEDVDEVISHLTRINSLERTIAFAITKLSARKTVTIASG